MTIKGFLTGSVIVALCSIFILCHFKKEHPASEQPCDQLKTKMTALIERGKAMQDRHGWLVTDCDGMEYSALASIGGLPGFDPLAAEITTGQFYKRPGGNCDVSFDRDMAMGYFYWLWAGDQPLSERVLRAKEHSDFIVSNHFVSGFPETDTRTWYSPQLVGVLFNIQYLLGGQNSGYRAFPAEYLFNLTGYERRLMLLDIALHGEMGEFLHDVKHIPRLYSGVSEMMWKRIEFAYDDDPKDVIAAALHGIYGGDYSRAFDLCQHEIVPDYEKCPGQEGKCELAITLFACSRVLKRCEN